MFRHEITDDSRRTLEYAMGSQMASHPARAQLDASADFEEMEH
jgi:hypothetical protein